MKNFIKNALLALGSIVFTLLLLEGMFRFLPVYEGYNTQPVNAESPVFHFAPNRTFTWSKFADFSMANVVHSNNYGYINDQDYDPKSDKPLIAVIGDSYVEAVMVPYAETLHGRMAEGLKKDWRVYSFGASGAPLSQYLAFAKLARDEFKPQKLIVVIIGNDFDESLMRYKSNGGFHYFKETKDGDLTLERVDYTPSFLGKVVRHSALLRYLLGNVQILARVQQFMAASKVDSTKEKKFAGQTDASTNPLRLKLSKQATMEFLKLLPEYSGVKPENILLVADTIRPDIYVEGGFEKVSETYVAQMRNFILEQASKQGYQTLDTTEAFVNDFKKNNKKFEYPKDGHWSGYGHKIVYDTIQKGDFFK